ncbi:MAG: hypothetical protein WAQ98_16780 [Blastocatellia bacterium]
METRINKTEKAEVNKTSRNLIDEDWTNLNLSKQEANGLCSDLSSADSLGIEEDCVCKAETDNNVAGLKVTKEPDKFNILNKLDELLEKISYTKVIVGFVICTFVGFTLDLARETYKTSETLSEKTIESSSVVESSQIIESENTSSTEVEEISYQQDLSLTNPKENPYITLAVDGVTVIESDEPILKVINGNESLSIEESTFPSKKLYVVGKESLESGNLILVTKSHTFNLYYEIRSDATPGNFNILVKIKK